MKTEFIKPYRYRWTEDCFPLSADSFLLGAFCTLHERDHILDLGCGAGLLLLLCARRCANLHLSGVERDPTAAGLAKQNLAENGLAGIILEADIRTLALQKNQDLVLSNPPWYAADTGASGKPGRMETGTLQEWCKAASDALRWKGRFALVHRPDRLVDLFAALRKAGLEPKRLQFCQHSVEKPPFAALVEAVKGGKPALTVLPASLYAG